MQEIAEHSKKESWNKGKLVGQKLPFILEGIWGIRIRLELSDNLKELALFNLAIDSKLRVSVRLTPYVLARLNS